MPLERSTLSDYFERYRLARRRAIERWCLWFWQLPGAARRSVASCWSWTLAWRHHVTARVTVPPRPKHSLPIFTSFRDSMHKNTPNINFQSVLKFGFIQIARTYYTCKIITNVFPVVKESNCMSNYFFHEYFLTAYITRYIQDVWTVVMMLNFEQLNQLLYHLAVPFLFPWFT